MRREALEMVAHIDARIRDKLLKRARKQGLADQNEVIGLVDARKAAARGDGKRPKRRKGH
jgi:hypothetical protein